MDASQAPAAKASAAKPPRGPQEAKPLVAKRAAPLRAPPDSRPPPAKAGPLVEGGIPCVREKGTVEISLVRAKVNTPEQHLGPPPVREGSTPERHQQVERERNERRWWHCDHEGSSSLIPWILRGQKFNLQGIE